MKKLIKAMIIVIAVAGTTLFASGGHSHDENGGHHSYTTPVNKTVAKEKAFEVVNSFIKKNVIDKSWSSSSMDTAEKKVINKNEEWVVIFINKKIKDKKKEKIYVFLTPSGKYIAANYTGN